MRTADRRATAAVGGKSHDRLRGVVRRLSNPSLAARVFLLNAGVLTAAVVALMLTPATVSSPIAVREAVILAAGLAALLVLNYLVLRRALSPLTRLSQAMQEVEPLHPGDRVPVTGGDVEVIRLAEAFNDMLGRLEAERRESVRRSLAAQEGERQRVARELHDEVGQTLTAVLLQLERLVATASEEQMELLREVRETARSSLEEVRSVAQRLRPEALDDLGLRNALASLCQRVSDHGKLELSQSIDPLPLGLSPEAELVVYRIAQEALTNVLRHADARHVLLTLRTDGDALRLRIVDDGVGMDGAAAGAGIQGMRERALLVGGIFGARSRPNGGTEVSLELDAGAGSQ